MLYLFDPFRLKACQRFILAVYRFFVRFLGSQFINQLACQFLISGSKGKLYDKFLICLCYGSLPLLHLL